MRAPRLLSLLLPLLCSAWVHAQQQGGSSSSSSSSSARCPLTPHRVLNNAPQQSARLEADCAGPFDARFCTRCFCALQGVYDAPPNAAAIRTPACSTALGGVTTAAWGVRLMTFESMEALSNCQDVQSINCDVWNAKRPPPPAGAGAAAGRGQQPPKQLPGGRVASQQPRATDCPFTKEQVTAAEVQAVKTGCDARKQGAAFCKACLCAVSKAHSDIAAARARGVKDPSTLSLCRMEVSAALSGLGVLTDAAAAKLYRGLECKSVLEATKPPQDC